MMVFRILFLKTLKLKTFKILSSRMFHSIAAEENNKFLKEKKTFCLEKGYVFSISSGVRGMP